MNTIFINTENGRTSEHRVLLLNLTNKIEAKKLLHYQILVFITHGKI